VSFARLAVRVATAILLATTSTPASGQTATASPPVTLYGVVTPDPSALKGASSAELAAPAAVGAQDPKKRVEFVFAPIPIINPTIENGLAIVTGFLYRIDRNDLTTPPSATGVLGFKTTNGSWAGAVVQSLHLRHDQIRLLGVGAYGDINYGFYGIGQSAGDAGTSIELNQSGPVGVVEGLVRVHGPWYVGARYLILHMNVRTEGATIPDGPTFPGIDSDIRTAALGPRIDYDSRDSTFYARRGMQGQGIFSFYDEAVGGRRTYQSYEVYFSRYRPMGRKHVLAWHLSSCGVQGDAPFYDLCLLGRDQDLRGYPLGQYRDRAMLAGQVEWRSELWWRFGAAAFIGGGEVAPDFDRFTLKKILPGGGVGLRFTLATQNHVNLRIDYAWGKNSSALYMGIIEAF